MHLLHRLPNKIASLLVLILPYKGSGDLFMARYAYLQVEPANGVLTGVDEGLE